MVADERFSNPAGTIQGGFISAMIDSAMGASVITYVSGQKVFASNSDLHVRFTKAARIGSMLTCEAVVISGGRTVVFVEATVTDDSDRLIARGSSTYHLVPRA
jgi:uncharacterized protein (TIGR00369 family)